MIYIPKILWIEDRIEYPFGNRDIDRDIISRKKGYNPSLNDTDHVETTKKSSRKLWKGCYTTLGIFLRSTKNGSTKLYITTWCF